MKKYLIFILLLIITKAGIAQNRVTKPTEQNRNHYQYRTDISEPDYDLKKVKELIFKNRPNEIPKNSSNDEIIFSHDRNPLKDTIYESLSLREKFTYNMIYTESYSQNCSGGTLIESDGKKEIFARLSRDILGFYWSTRQRDFFKSNKDSVIELMSNSILISKRVGLNYKSVIEMINATKTIPILIEVYAVDKKDRDILTLLMLLMKENKYAPFMNSQIYRDLYGADQSSYRTSLPFDPSNEKAIIRLANNFYYELPN